MLSTHLAWNDLEPDNAFTFYVCWTAGLEKQTKVTVTRNNRMAGSSKKDDKVVFLTNNCVARDWASFYLFPAMRTSNGILEKCFFRGSCNILLNSFFCVCAFSRAANFSQWSKFLKLSINWTFLVGLINSPLDYSWTNCAYLISSLTLTSCQLQRIT